MSFSEADIESLRLAVKGSLSSHRYLHTLGVENAAVKLGMIFCPSLLPELRVAALLHDVTKELSPEKTKEILTNNDLITDDCMWNMPAVFHSLTAPSFIRKEYPLYATENVLSAVYHHTVGAPNMSLFDKIIFIADYVEENRTYPSCVSTRAQLFDGITSGISDKLTVLNQAILSSLDATILSLTASSRYICPMTVSTRNAILTELSQG